MKKIFAIVTFVLISLTAFSQEKPSMFECNRGIGFDFLMGTDYNSFMYGGSMYVEGFYLDLLNGAWSISKGATRGIYAPGNYPDGKSFALHVGYFFPIIYQRGNDYSGFSYLRIAPVIGLWSRQYGVTSIYRYNWGWCRGNYSRQYEKDAFDFGVNIRYDFGKQNIWTLSFSAEITVHTLMFGTGMTF